MAIWPATPADPRRRRPWLLRSWRRPAWWLAALAVLLRVLVPAGFMPAPAAAGTLALVLCTGHGTVTLRVDAAGTPVAPQNDPAGTLADHHPCPFASASTGPVPPATLLLAPAARWRVAYVGAGATQCLARPQAGLPPPATAPPISA